ncbi:MAG: ABC transporter ATP-binding protein [Bacteroidia bacterium]|nr:MAG: ABC transporter ATP-binding protein [Bacteroidia bacterium]
MDAVRLNAVTKVFREEGQPDLVAVDNLSLSIRRGEIFSLVGPDGAGKTTTIRMMCGVLFPTSGSVEILGLDQRSHHEAIKHKIGYLSQKFSLYGDLTVDENIDFFAEIHRMKDFRKRKEELLDFMRLTPFRDRLAERLSGGMKQKLALACTLIHTPEVIFLDEPTTGVDPVSRRDFWKILSNVLKSGISIVMATPYLDEAERSARVALLNKGQLLLVDTPEKIRSSFNHPVLEIIADHPREVLHILRNIPSIRSAQLFGDRLHVVAEEGAGIRDVLESELRSRGISARSIRRVAPSLEDVFISRIS